MTDVLWPTNIIPSSQTWGVVDNVGVNQSPLSGSIRTVARTGARMKCTITVPPLKGQDRARMKAFIAALRGRSNRAYVPDFSTTLRGSFPATELLTNNEFTNSTTGWGGGTDGSLSVTDQVARVTRVASSGSEIDLIPSSYSTVSQYAPYVGRGVVSGSQLSAVTAIGLYINDSAAISNSSTSTTAMFRVMLVPTTTSLRTYLYNSSVGQLAGSFFDSPYMSLSRCALADNGLNALTNSDQLDNAAWTKTRCSATANAHTAPDGTSTADKITEDSSNNTHFFLQSYVRASQAEDWCAYGSFQRSVGTRNVLVLIASDTTPTNYAYAYINLGTGAVMASGVNGTATNVRVFVSSDSTYYRVHVVGRLAASTTAMAYFALANASPTQSYAGDGSSAIAAWRCGAAQSSVPVRTTQTVASANASGTAQTGSAIYVKGLPVSTSGLLKAGDMVQLGNQINIVTAPLDSDAAGLGYLQCGNPWRASIADNDPIIVKTPMAKMILASEDMSWETGPGQFSPFQLEFIEDVT